MSEKNLIYQNFYRRNLPHIQPKDRIFFVTYRLRFSLPDSVRQKLRRITRLIPKPENHCDQFGYPDRLIRAKRQQFLMLDHHLDQCRTSPQWLADRRIAAMVTDSLHFLHERMADILCYTIMPNHVHLLMEPRSRPDGEVYSLSSIMHSHKSYTANQANRVLERKGAFWQHENFDHYLRSGDEMRRTCRYILKNPVKAGLVDSYEKWPHFWINDEVQELLQL